MSDDLLLGDAAGELLAAALAADGVMLRGWRRTSIHPRGNDLSVVFTVEADGADAAIFDLVVHVSSDPVPAGATILAAGGSQVHVWRVPHDPYLPGLAAALTPARVRELLDGLGAEPEPVTLTTRAYRPTRRAVVEVRIGEQHVRSVLYLKVLGGRTLNHIRDRTLRLAGIHRALSPGLPVPELCGVAPAQGLVAIAALRGETLRSALVLGHELPPATDVVALSQRLAGSELVSVANPRRYADVSRHVALLAAAIPDLRDKLTRAAAFAASVGGQPVTVHGDLHDGQLLVDRGAITGLLDIDGVGTGLLAQDAGRLVAYLQSATADQRTSPERVETYVDELIRHYIEAGIDSRDLAAGAAGAWIGLATAPYRWRGQDWQDRVRERVERSLRWTHADGR